MKKIIILVIAIVLALSVVGTCFALYKINAEDRTISLTTGDAITLVISAGDFGDVRLSPGCAPVTKSVTLNVNKSVSDAGMYGKFKVEISGALENYITVDATGGITKDDAALKEGVHYALTDLPTTFELRFTFTATADEFFGLAEGNATVRLTWVIDESYTGPYTPKAGYYLVGKLNGGAENWAPSADTYHFATAGIEATNKAELKNVSLKAGDIVKIKDHLNDVWYGNWKDYTAIGSLDANGNLVIKADGTYSFYLNSADEIYPVKN
ncbi:MAG: hypothetical protein IJX70_02270 [Clostridia bacterium]|nr:hypothetical protein [Clostridia bacterium]